MGADPNYALRGTDARMAALEKQVLLLRGDLQKAYREIAECRSIIQEKDKEIAALKNDNIRLTGEVNALNEAMRRLASEGGDSRLLRRYENPDNPGDTSWNDKRKKLLDDERRYEAAQNGEELKDPKMGPPEGHPGHRRTFEGPVIFHDTPPCPVCGTVEHTTPLSKTMLEFDGDSRHMSYARHAGHTVTCLCNRTIQPEFPGLPGTFFGNEALRHIMVYATRRSTDSDISYYFGGLNGAHVSPTSILNARHSISVPLEPTIYHIIAELKRARFIQIDETPYKYRKRKGYVWVVRTDTACLVLALTGRGGDDILPFVGELLDKPVTVDGYSVYTYLFRTRQRCWAHILRGAEDVCISHPDTPHYRDLYRSLKLVLHRAKEAAARTAAAGGAPMDTCKQFADEVRGLAARYGSLKFAGTLHAAADNLFTFLRYPGMPPTNNGSERDIRDWVVPIREVSHKFMTERGMRTFSILQSFAATCSKLNLDVGESFLRVLRDPTYNIVREGLSAAPPAPPMLPVCGTPPMLPAPLPAARPTPSRQPALPAAPPMLPAPLPAALPASRIPAKPPPTSPPYRPFHGMGWAGRPALLMLLAMPALFMQDMLELMPPSYGWEHAIDHQAFPTQGSLATWQDRVPQTDWGG